jgi:23S rRNA (adenine2503-C2)-methyltransferase
VTHILGMLPGDFACSESEAARILARAYGHRTTRPVARRMIEPFDERRLEIIDRATDPSDGFEKFLFRLHDGALAEAVRIPLEREGCFTVCLSSQAGCAMGCDFCATGRLGLTRNLEAWEIVAQFVAVRDDVAPPPPAAFSRLSAVGGGAARITGAVFQGQGEPLHNYDNVMRAAQILSNPACGRISAKAITISTVGLVPAIHRYACERRPYRLIVSMTSAIDAKRRELLPVASAWSAAELADAIRVYQRAAGGRVTIAWVVLGGINTGRDEVDALRALFDGVPLRINLIDVNGSDYVRANETELAAFRDELRTLGVPVVRRYSGGAARHAACGMLASQRGGQAPSPVHHAVAVETGEGACPPA